MPKAGVVRLGIKDAQDRPQEVGYFIIDAADPKLRSRCVPLYGEKPESLEITFYSDSMEDIYSCTFNRWGKDRKGVSRLLCQGNGKEAIEKGQRRSCPCPSLGKECQMKAVLKFLLPDLTMGGYFILATRSPNNADNIETALRLVAKATGGLITRKMRLRRTTGYAEVNGIRVKKYYVALEGYQALSAAVSDAPTAVHARNSAEIPAALPQEAKQGSLTSIAHILRPPDDVTIARQEQMRVREGRKKVRDKIRVHIMEPGAVEALEVYACRVFSKSSFEDLTVEELLKLWYAIGDEPEVVSQIYSLLLHKKKVTAINS